jgi:hypothetical protein
MDLVALPRGEIKLTHGNAGTTIPRTLICDRFLTETEIVIDVEGRNVSASTAATNVTYTHQCLSSLPSVLGELIWNNRWSLL